MTDYDALKNKIVYLKAKRDYVESEIEEYYRIAGLSWLESQRNPKLDDVSPMYMSAVMALVNQKVDLEAEIANLQKRLPCERFIQRFGLGLHEAYREKYPINKDTAICDVDTLFPVWRYVIPSDELVGVSEAPDLYAPRPVIHYDYGEARFETWGYKPQPWRRLAFAPEINTVFVQVTP